MLPRLTTYLRVLACAALLFIASCGGNGSGNESAQLRLTVMGDSLAAGAIATQGYAPRYRDYVTTDLASTSLTDLGQNGWTSGELLNALQTDMNFQSSVTASEVVVWNIGGDDLLHAFRLFLGNTCGGIDNQQCLRDAVTNFGPNWDAIVQQILALRDKNRTVIRTMDIYNPFVAALMATGTYNAVEPYLDQVNAHIATSCTANALPMAKVHEAFNGPDGTQDAVAKGYIAFDGVHPNDTGHKAIADALRATGYAPLK